MRKVKPEREGRSGLPTATGKGDLSRDWEETRLSARWACGGGGETADEGPRERPCGGHEPGV
jgi:hypothetical protein